MSVKICNGTVIRPHPGITHSEERCPLCEADGRMRVAELRALKLGLKNDELCDEIFELKRGKEVKS